MRSILKESDRAELCEGLRRCSPATLEAAIRFREFADHSAIPEVVFGIIERYQSSTSPVKLADAGDNVRLIEDIGLDSLTLLEIVMTIEEVLKLRIENEELRSIRTLGQLNDFLQGKITGENASPRGRRLSREDITLILPQQPPFLFLDSAELHKESVTAHYLIKGDEFFLEGHFKNDPVFPASIVFEAMGQAACLWLLEQGYSQLGKKVESNQVYFASLDGAHFYRKTGPGEELTFEVKPLKLRNPLAIFEGTVSSRAGKVARIGRLTLAFGVQPEPNHSVVEVTTPRSVPKFKPPPVPSPVLQNGHH